MSFFAKPGPAICLLPLSRGRHRDFPAGLPMSGGKTKALDCSGYRYPSQRSLSPARPLPGERSGWPPRDPAGIFHSLFCRKAPGGALPGRPPQIQRSLPLPLHSSPGRCWGRYRPSHQPDPCRTPFTWPTEPPGPYGLRSLSSPNGPDRWPFFSGPENTAARSRQKRSPASRRAGL